jgi:hypothetical protein
LNFGQLRAEQLFTAIYPLAGRELAKSTATESITNSKRNPEA